MNLYFYDNCLVVAESATDALDKIKNKLSYVYLEDLCEEELTLISEVDGYKIEVIQSKWVFITGRGYVMECVRCEKELLEEEIEYDYMGNEWCKECMKEEMEREY